MFSSKSVMVLRFTCGILIHLDFISAYEVRNHHLYLSFASPFVQELFIYLFIFFFKNYLFKESSFPPLSGNVMLLSYIKFLMTVF